jgi:hypothetical protein
LPNPRPWLEKRLGPLASLAHIFRPGEIAPLAIKGGVVADTTVRAAETRETLNQLFDRAAKYPWRPLPEQAPPGYVCESSPGQDPSHPLWLSKSFVAARAVAQARFRAGQAKERRNKPPDA